MKKQTIYIIAEIGINHNGNLNIGWRLGATRIDTRPDGKR